MVKAVVFEVAELYSKMIPSQFPHQRYNSEQESDEHSDINHMTEIRLKKEWLKILSTYNLTTVILIML